MNNVRMYTTQVCPFCIRAKALLKQRGVEAIEEIRVDLDPGERNRMVEITGRRTVPQIFIGQTHVGGCDDLHELDAAAVALAAAEVDLVVLDCMGHDEAFRAAMARVSGLPTLAVQGLVADIAGALV